MQLDSWQEKVLETEGNIVLRSGRQVGKSTVIAIKAAEYAIQNSKSSIMIISATERQAYLLFSKVLDYLDMNFKKEIDLKKNKPTKSAIILKNKSIIRCLPTGLDGLGIRGFTINLLIADEAAFIPKAVYDAVTPGLLTTGGQIILLSTPCGKTGYFYDCFQNKEFTAFHINSLEVAEGREEPQRTYMLNFFESERKRMSKAMFQQEYLGEFVGGIGQLYDDEMIKACMTEDRTENPIGKNYIGVDIARYGGDESAWAVFRTEGNTYKHIESQAKEDTPGTYVFEETRRLNEIFKPKKIGIDTGGLGATIYDFLMQDAKLESKLVDMNNAKRVYEKNPNGTDKKAKLLKEVMYYDLKVLMEQGRVKLLKDENIFFSLKSIMVEMTDTGEIKITGNYSHIAEAIIRAVRLANQDKSLNLWAEYK